MHIMRAMIGAAAVVWAAYALAAETPVVIPSAVPSTASENSLPPNPDRGNFEGMWQPLYVPSLVESALGTSGVVKTIEGKLPPFTAEAQSLFWHRVDMEQRGTPIANSATLCRPGIPHNLLDLFLGPFEVIQTKDRVLFLFELNTRYWAVHLDRQHPKNIESSYTGDSVGHWEGDTLVIDSVGFNDKTWIDSVGTPHSTALRLITRVTKVSEGRQLRFLITVDDPQAYREPWTMVKSAEWRPEMRMLETHCLENTREENNEGIVYE
jgi:hypothetical protein